jgi:hypothetical protein
MKKAKGPDLPDLWLFYYFKLFPPDLFTGFTAHSIFHRALLTARFRVLSRFLRFVIMDNVPNGKIYIDRE